MLPLGVVVCQRSQRVAHVQGVSGSWLSFSAGSAYGARALRTKGNLVRNITFSIERKICPDDPIKRGIEVKRRFNETKIIAFLNESANFGFN